jgi:esterase/lipase superfamily enzyme/TPR repeat protein
MSRTLLVLCTAILISIQEGNAFSQTFESGQTAGSGVPNVGTFAVPDSVLVNTVSGAKRSDKLAPWSDTLKLSFDSEQKLLAADGLVFQSSSIEQQELGVELLKELASGGNPDAAFKLGIAYDRGIGVSRNSSTAFKYLSDAATAGNANASWAIGRAYRDGLGAPIDYSTSIKWLNESYESGNRTVAIDLATAYQFGLGVPPDPIKSEAFWKTAVDSGSAEANLGYADFLAANSTGEVDLSALKPYFDAASNTGDLNSVWASYELAVYTKDLEAQKQSIEHLKVLSENKDALATAKLGDAYLSGLLMPIDERKAYELYRTSANSGNTYGQARMGALLLERPQLDPDISQSAALQVLFRAAEAGQPEALMALASQEVLPLDSARRFEYASLAREIGGPQYDEPASKEMFSVCNENVDPSCEPVPVYFITNREEAEDKDNVTFLNRLASEGKLTFGVSAVTIPTSKSVNTARKSIWQSFRDSILPSSPRSPPDTGAFLVTNTIVSGGLEGIISEAHKAAMNNGISKAFVYIHGFNNTFDDAVSRMAQLSEQAKYPGVPIVLSWASAGSTVARFSPKGGYSGIGYNNDLLTADTSCAHFRTALGLVAKEFGAENVMVLGHSMGGKLLYNILAGCPSVGGTWPSDETLGDVVLAAPDIDVAQFKQNVTNAKNSTKSFTLYVSANDLALIASEKAVGLRKRVGKGGDERLLVAGIQTIDATTVESKAIGSINHGYVFDTPQVKRDLSELLRGESDPNKRVCPKQYMDQLSGLSYWLIQPDCTN